MPSPGYEYNVSCFGEILWDLLPGGAVPGGAPMNVAYHLHQLGESPALITRIGTDERGTQLQQILNSKNIGTRYLQQDREVATGIVHATPDEKGDMTYDIVAPAAWDHIQPAPGTLALVNRTDYFVFGSLATRHEVSRNSLWKFLEQANTKVLDINLRAPYIDRSVIEKLLHSADLVKVNDAELELITGWWGNERSLKGRIELLMRKFHNKAVIVTRGANGAAVHYNGVLYEHPGFRVKVADTVGSGDSFLAGFLHRLIQGDNARDALAFASRLGAFVATKTGAWPDYSISELNALTN